MRDGMHLIEPDVGHRNGQFDVAHPLAADTREGYLDAAPVANHSPMLDALVLAARAFPIARRAEDAFAEKAAFLRLERPIVDGLGVLYLSLAPAPDTVRRGNRDMRYPRRNRAGRCSPEDFANIDILSL